MDGWVELRLRPLVSCQNGLNQNRLLKFRSLQIIVNKCPYFVYVVVYVVAYVILKGSYEPW